ncbi:DUF5105 domain-containing protein [Bacillus sp. MUM 13]|uniref:DUF5105 domain-containing protein n=1 Tax=Bacillus sp. MUM 13 TaxID=1678001 RepID=UPI0008F5B723|nr:DUF5105 domain-containing protein [Bacillus sp. MUM 13]OIK13439.1 hypothetical protein BIV59_05705 [Bacillus sp. MUM 13]
MLKKWSITILFVALLLSLAACSGNGEKAEADGKSDVIEAGIEGASYILPGKEDGISEGDQKSGILQVNLKIKNVSKSSIRLSSYDGVKFYDGDEQLKPKDSVANSNLDLSYDTSSGEIGPGKVQKVTYFFDVEKDKEYKIGLKPRLSDSMKEANEVLLKLNTKKYADSFDALQDPEKALIAYIDTIYLDKDNADYEKYVTADKAALQDEAQKTFRNEVKDGVGDSISDSEADKHYATFKSILAQKAKMKATTTGNANGKAIVKLDYSSVSLEDLYKEVYKYKSAFREKTGIYDTDKGDQYALSKLDLVLNSLDIESNRNPVDVKMVKKDGKWTIDRSDEFSDSLVDVFAKGYIY